MSDLLEQLEQLIEAKVKALQSDNRLWGYEDIAHYCHRSKHTIINDYSKRPDFPNAIRFEKRGSPVYDPRHVKAWVMKHMEKAA